jgi:hypothetical protein
LTPTLINPTIEERAHTVAEVVLRIYVAVDHPK